MCARCVCSAKRQEEEKQRRQTPTRTANEEDKEDQFSEVRQGRLSLIWRRAEVSHSPSMFRDMSMFTLFFDSAIMACVKEVK